MIVNGAPVRARGVVRVPTAVDDRFAVRGPYWVPGMSVLAEPWVALAESSTGHLVVPCGRNAERAHRVVDNWRALVESGQLVDRFREVVSAAVVNPRGEIVSSWAVGGAALPTPGGEPRWRNLHRLLEAQDCRGCGAPRWPGCWVTREVNGCGVCLPQAETADPRRWPPEPSAPPSPVKRR